MATSSITKNFVVEGREQVEMFADAIEASAHDKPLECTVSYRDIKSNDDFKDFILKRNQAHATVR